MDRLVFVSAITMYAIGNEHKQSSRHTTHDTESTAPDNIDNTLPNLVQKQGP